MLRLAAIAVALSLTTILPNAASADDSVRWGYLDNGSGYLILSNRSGPMIGSSVIVLGGSGSESPKTQGASHFLEHLLFNGTKTRSQEDLYAAFDRLGTYSNASTRSSHVNYMILSPTRDFWDAFELQTDMIFGSTLPSDKLDKERGIILEELAKDRLQPTYDVERMLQADLFGTSGYGLPTLGTETSILALTRDDILGYYERFYGPENLLWVLVGDVDPAVAVDSLQARVGSIPARDLPRDEVPTLRPGPGVLRHTTEAVSTPTLRYSWVGPQPASPEFLAYEAAVEALGGADSSPIPALAQEVGAASASTRLSLFPGMSLLQMDVGLPLGTDAEAFHASFLAQLPSVAPVTAEQLSSWKIGRETGEVFLREKPHYYGIFQGERIVARGLPAFAAELTEIRDMKIGSVPSPATIFATAPVRVSILTPPSLSREARAAIAADTEGTATPNIEEFQLSNGMHVMTRTGAESPVLAAHVFVRGRSDREPVPGAAELLHSLLDGPTKKRSAEEMSSALSAIGAELKTHDSAFIPYDDFYSVPEFSYLRFQTLDRFAEDGFGILAEILGEPAVTEERYLPARASAVARAQKEETSPRTQVRRDVRDNYGLARSNAYVFGVSEDLSNLDFATFRAFTEDYLDPRGIYAVVASGLPPAELKELLESTLGSLRAGDTVLDSQWTTAPGSATPSASTLGTSMSEATGHAATDNSAQWTELFGEASPPETFVLRDFGGSQSSVTVTRELSAPGVSDEEMRVTASLLSDRLAFQLREREGLAYSISASITPLDEDRWLLTASAGTRPENLPRMVEGLRDAAAIAMQADWKEDAVETIVAGQEGRSLMRRLTRLNWAYHAGARRLSGRSLDDEAGYERRKAVDAATCRRLLTTVFQEGPEGVFIAR